MVSPWLVALLTMMRVPLAAQGAAEGPVLAAVAWGDCAPWDGPAFTVAVGRPGAKTVDEERPWLRIAIWHPAESRHGMTYRFADSNGETGAVSYNGTAFPGPTGTVTFASAGASNAVDGSFDLVAPNGRRLVGRFRARWMPRTFMCGT
jgi:hypothetical protein